MRNVILLSLAGLLFMAAIATWAEDSIDLVFADFRLTIPADPTHMGVQDQALFLALRYGSEQGQNYLTLTSQPDSPTNGCPPEEFFSRAMNSEELQGQEHLCAGEAVEDFQETFVARSESGIWSGEGFHAYYLIQEGKSMVYMVGSQGEYIKIDTDFMAPPKLEALVKGAGIL